MKSRFRGAWWGVGTLFLCHGLIVSTWVSRIPAVQTALGLKNGVLGLTLLASAIGAVTTIPFAGALVSRVGAKKVSVASGILFGLGVILPGLAFNAVSLAAALFVYGALAASMDVSMNALGVELEKAMGTPTMSRFHGMFSVGGMAGASVGGALAAQGLLPAAHFTLSGLVNALTIAASWPLLLETHDRHAAGDHRLPWNKIPAVLIAISVIGFCILLSEGAMADWTAVYLKQVLHSGPGMAAASFAVFSAAMAIFRLLGDIITARLGPIRTVCTGSLLAAAGLVWALSVRQPAWSLPGFALTGVGFSAIIPLVFGSGGRVPGVKPGPGIATVTGIGYVGFIVGPPLIGFASQLVTLRYALGVVVACCLLSAYLSRSMQSLAAEN